MDKSAAIKQPPIKKKRKLTKTAVMGLLFVTPALAFSFIFDWYPMFDGIIKSFYRWNGYNEAVFIGLDNFKEMFRDEVIWISLKNMLFFLGTGLVLMLPTMIASIVLFRVKNKQLQYIYRVLFCIPMVVPGMVTTLMWQFMYNPQYGLFNNLFEAMGRPEWQQTWLGDPDLVKWCIVFMGFPFVATNAALIYLGGLKSIPESVWEAAELDGCGPFKKFFYLEVPLIMGQFKLNLIGTITGSITGYGVQLILTQGGPGFSSMVPGMYMYNTAFTGNRYGYASAIGLMLFAVSLVITVITQRFIKSQEDI